MTVKCQKICQEPFYHTGVWHFYVKNLSKKVSWTTPGFDKGWTAAYSSGAQEALGSVYTKHIMMFLLREFEQEHLWE